MSVLRMREYSNPMRSLEFNGLDGFLDSFDKALSPGDPVTIEFWNYVPSAVLNGSYTPAAFGGDSNTNALRLSSHAPWGNGVLYWDYGDTGDGRIQVDYTPYLDVWTHIALTATGISNGRLEIILDGQLVAEKIGVPALSGGVQLETIGRSVFDNTQFHYHLGKIGLFRMFKEVRSLTDIQENMKRILPKNTLNLLVQYAMKEGAGDTTKESVNDVQSSLIGGVTWAEKPF
jgi:hypothetical protein